MCMHMKSCTHMDMICTVPWWLQYNMLMSYMPCTILYLQKEFQSSYSINLIFIIYEPSLFKSSCSATQIYAYTWYTYLILHGSCRHYIMMMSRIHIFFFPSQKRWSNNSIKVFIAVHPLTFLKLSHCSSVHIRSLILFLKWQFCFLAFKLQKLIKF